MPAAAIAAMAIQELGYGWTTLAQQTNDILAWKYTTASAAGGRDLWVFDCGASKDRYIVFPDRAQAVDFVAQQLATSDNYAAATDRYREERAQGVPVVDAIDRWIDDIADPYSTRPEDYRAAIKRVMNDPSAPRSAGRPTRTSIACRNRFRRQQFRIGGTLSWAHSERPPIKRERSGLSCFPALPSPCSPSWDGLAKLLARGCRWLNSFGPEGRKQVDPAPEYEICADSPEAHPPRYRRTEDAEQGRMISL